MKEISENFLRSLDIVVNNNYQRWIDDNLNRLRNQVAVNPKRLEGITWILPWKLKGRTSLKTIFVVALAVQYFDDIELRHICEICLLEQLRPYSFNIHRDELYLIDGITVGSMRRRFSEKLLYDITWMILQPEEDGRKVLTVLLADSGMERELFGNILTPDALKGVSGSLTRNFQRDPKRTQRRRGYNDKGSKRDETTIIPDGGIINQRNQYFLEEFQNDLQRNLRLCYKQVRLGISESVDLSKKEVEQIWNMTIRKPESQ